jgi:uroporphyrinogen decarboxylase
MRQAGRTDPEYNRLKEECGLSLHDMFRNAEVAAQASLLPQRFGVDAIIFFQDILTLLGPMGAEFFFKPGPVLERPVRSRPDVRALKPYDVADRLPFVPETFRLVRASLDGELPVLGFAGAPLTLAVFLAEGGSFGARAEAATTFMRDDPEAMHELLAKLADMTVDYLKLQAEAGAEAVQLFESAAYLFTPEQYSEFALPYQQRIFDGIRGHVRSIVFARGAVDLSLLNAAGADIISLSSEVSIREARETLGSARVIQGNLNNRLLANGSLDQIAEAARDCIASGEGRGHIFNLDHGLLRETPFENILHLIRTVHETPAGV